jgi:uncharacterized protein
MAHRKVAEPAAGERTGGWRLANESSAYLREAAGQPVAWHPWGPEAFEEAKRLNRPILLDVGAVWCHWCHVMDEGTYTDAEVARLIDQFFVAVKVDRDEHPEVDRRYQRQVNALTGEGGWPLTAFLSPAGDVFLGGTYFPAQDAVGRPGFRRVLKEVARLWKEEPETVQQNASAIQGALQRSAGHASPASELGELTVAIRHDIESSFDPVNAGFGHAPKFPHPTAIAFLLLEAFRSGDAGPADRARDTLLHMADGGMYDHVGGGFHRYSVDEGWHIPHFEKMGVDNAALLDIYVDGARRFHEPRFHEVVRETARWTLDVLGDPRGGFGASQDADNGPGDDGSYFTWTRAELKAALDADEFRFVHRFYGLGTEGRMPHDPDRNVLFRPLPFAEAIAGTGWSEPDARRVLAAANGKLRAVRATRPTPVVDRAIYASINGAYIRAFARAGQLLDDSALVDVARRSAERFLSDGYKPSAGVAHLLGDSGPSGWGLLDDQAEFALGLIELAAVTADPRFVPPARDLLETVLREYRDESGLLRDLAPKIYDGPRIGAVDAPSYPLEDSPHLSANAATALALLRLGALTGDEAWRGRAEPLIAALSGRLRHAGLFAAGTGLAAGLLALPSARVVIEGTGATAQALARAAEGAWHPLGYVFRSRPPAPFSLPEELATGKHAGSPRALVCFGTHCLAPISDPAELARVYGSPSGAPTG